MSGGPGLPGRSGEESPGQEVDAARQAEESAGFTRNWPETGSTGDPAVDAVLGTLDGVEDHPVSAHAELYTAVHDALLAELTTDA